MKVEIKRRKRSRYGVWVRISENYDTTTSSQLQKLFLYKVSLFMKIANNCRLPKKNIC